MGRETIRELLDVAKGHAKPDIVIKNGRVINVFTDSIENASIAIKNGFVVLVEKELNDSKCDIIDAEGLYLCPGFIDAHTHLDSLIPFHELVPYALRGGTTTVITECAMVGCACGKEGIETFLESTKGYPLRCFFVAPPLTPPFPFAERCKGITLRDFKDLMKKACFLGIGEAYWTRIIEGDERVLKQAEIALSLKKRLDGHSSGAKGRKLTQYVLTGITSCHESVTVDEALEKIRQGLYVMIREGFVRKELKELSKLKDEKLDKKRLILVSDTFDAIMLMEGYMDRVVKAAIDYGFSPIDAIKMATINPAEYHNLRYLGAIAPLRYADILFISDLHEMKIEKVMFDGKVLYSHGKFLCQSSPFSYPKSMLETIFTDPLRREDFEIRIPRNAKGIRLIEIVNETITKEFKRKGLFDLSQAKKEDIALVSVLNRGRGKRYGMGFIKGTGIKSGAVATSLIWDTGNILGIGSSAEELVKAMNRIVEMQGGLAISKNGKIIYEFPMPIFGLIPVKGMKEIAEKTMEFEEKIKKIGSTLKRPFLTLQVLSFTGLPFLRITDKGLFDVKEKRIVSPFFF